jgi:YegS/Rv2252/BmrU family lipid kinase
MAVNENIDIVVAIGGDGTVNEVGSALCGTDTALAIVPSGSGNGLARHLRISMNASRALQVLNNGVVGKFDYCTANGKPFFCACGMGFDAKVSYKFSNEGTRGFITYIKTALAEYIKYKPQEYLIDIDGTKMQEKAFVIACCNAAQYGNNAYIAPRATMQDGLIDVTVMHPFRLVESPLIGARLFLRQLGHDHNVSIYRGKRVVIERHHDDIIHIDGDPISMPACVVIENVSRGISILVPPTLPDDV